MLRNRYPLNSGVSTDASSPHSFYLQMIYKPNLAKEVGDVSVQREYAECPGSEPSLPSICGTHKKVDDTARGTSLRQSQSRLSEAQNTRFIL